jgi:hypothetical protein
MSLAPTNEESAWAQWGKNLYRKKIVSQLSACDVTRVVSLDTINQVYVYEESGELYEICNLLFFITRWFVNQMVLVFLCSFIILDLFFKRCYSPDNYLFQFVPHWTLIVCSFVFEWRNLLGIW